MKPTTTDKTKMTQNKKVDGRYTNNSGKYCSSNMCRDQTNLMNVCSHVASLFLIMTADDGKMMSNKDEQQ